MKSRSDILFEIESPFGLTVQNNRRMIKQISVRNGPEALSVLAVGAGLNGVVNALCAGAV